MILIILVIAAGAMFAVAFYLWASANQAERMVRGMLAEAQHAQSRAEAETESKVRAESEVKTETDASLHRMWKASERDRSGTPSIIGVPVKDGPGKTRTEYHFVYPDDTEDGHASIVKMWVEHVPIDQEQSEGKGDSPSGSSSS